MKTIILTSVIISLSSQKSFLFPDSEEYHQLIKKHNDSRTRARQHQTDEILDNEIDVDASAALKAVCSNNSQDFQDNPACYPVQQIKKALEKQNSSLSLYFSKSKTPESSESSLLDVRTDEVYELLPRARSSAGVGVVEWRDLCETRTEFITPRQWNNTRGETLFIVNTGDDDELTEYVQQVRVTKCHGDVPARDLHFPARCRQEFTEHKLMALAGDGSALIIDSFMFQSGCVCEYDDTVWDMIH